MYIVSLRRYEAQILFSVKHAMCCCVLEHPRVYNSSACPFSAGPKWEQLVQFALGLFGLCVCIVFCIGPGHLFVKYVSTSTIYLFYCLQEGHRGCDRTVVLYTYLTMSSVAVTTSLNIWIRFPSVASSTHTTLWSVQVTLLRARDTCRACLEVAGRGCPFDKGLSGHN